MKAERTCSPQQDSRTCGAQMKNRTPLDGELPVGELDPAIVELCRAINEFPDIRTSESCQGFVDGHRPGEPWAVYFQPTPSPPTPDGYASLEFMAWLCCYTARERGFDVSVELNAPPPYLNGPGECLYFIIKGRNRHPTEFAQFIREVRGQVCRRQQLRRHPLCAACFQDNVSKAATVAHHVQDHKGDWKLFCNLPLESLCKPCHDRIYLGSEVLGYQRGCDINGRPYKTHSIYIDKNKRTKAGGWPKT